MTQYDDLFNVRDTLYRDGGNARSNKTIYLVVLLSIAQ